MKILTQTIFMILMSSTLFGQDLTVSGVEHSMFRELK